MSWGIFHTVLTSSKIRCHGDIFLTWLQDVPERFSTRLKVCPTFKIVKCTQGMHTDLVQLWLMHVTFHDASPPVVHH